MDLLDAIILGIIQGVTEFLPVSSSGHLELGKVLLGDTSVPEESLLFTVVLHFATALSTLVVYRKDVWEILRGLFAFKDNEGLQFSLKVILSMIPAAVVVLFFEDELEKLFSGNILLVGSMLLITALLLFLADRAKTTHKNVSYGNSLVIGIAQAVAMLPGISRSGATIATSVLLGVDKQKAARFSFLIDFQTNNFGALSAGFIAAFLAGLLACTWMIRLVRNSRLTFFAVYCLIVGCIAIAAALWL